MAFTSWALVLADLKDVIAGRMTEKIFWQSHENSREMRVTYTVLGNITAFYEWVEMKASEEAMGACPGQFYMSIGA